MAPLDGPPRLQHDAELEALLALYRERRPRRVLEIGVYEGGTLFHWLKEEPELVVAVDDVGVRGGMPGGWVTGHTELTVLRARSDHSETIERVDSLAPFDWVFIDADHSYDAVRADWETYSPMCNGVLVFHDILPPSADHPEIQVSRLWQEIKAAGWRTQEIIEDPAASWGGIGVVFISDERSA